jgi:aryl-alcohol dehydrogenase-like predicted oxidoreductase
LFAGVLLEKFMERNRLGKTDLSVAPLGFGAFGAAQDPDATGYLLDMMIDRGVNLIDTAQIYPGSEDFLGSYLRNRHNLVVVTKCGEHEILSDGAMRSKRISIETIDTSLRRLGRDCLDIVLLHSYDLDMLKSGEAIEVLRKAREQGKLRYFGYSGDNENAKYAASIPEISVIETSLSLCDQSAISHLLPDTRRNDIGIIAKRPVANAVWRYRDVPLADVPEHVREYTRRFKEMNVEFDQFAREASCWAELFLRFTISISGVHCAIVGTTNPANAERNLRFAEEGPLSGKSVQAIREAFGELRRNSEEDLAGLN